MLDRREEVALLPLEAEEAGLLLTSVPDDARDECWWLVLPDGTPVRGDDGGGAAVFAEIWLTRPLSHALRVLRASALVDAFDRLVSRHRGTLGGFVPDGPAPRRYP